MAITQLRKTPYQMQRVVLDFKRRASQVRKSGNGDEWKSKQLTSLAQAASTEFFSLQQSLEAEAPALYDAVLGHATAAAQKTVADMFADGASVQAIAEYAVAVGNKEVLAALKEAIPQKAYAGLLPPPGEPERAKNIALELLYQIARTSFPEIDMPLHELEISRPCMKWNVEGWSDYFNRAAVFLDDAYMVHLNEPPLYGWLGLPGSTASAYLPTDQEVTEPPDEAAYHPQQGPLKDRQDLGVTNWGAKGAYRTEAQREPRSGDPGYF